MKFLVNCWLLHEPKLPFQPVSNEGSVVIHWSGFGLAVHSDDWNTLIIISISLRQRPFASITDLEVDLVFCFEIFSDLLAIADEKKKMFFEITRTVFWTKCFFNLLLKVKFESLRWNLCPNCKVGNLLLFSDSAPIDKFYFTPIDMLCYW